MSEGGLEPDRFHAQNCQLRRAEREIGFRWVPLLTVEPCDVPPEGAPILKLYLTIVSPEIDAGRDDVFLSVGARLRCQDRSARARFSWMIKIGKSSWTVSSRICRSADQ